eukprot:29701-Eustigmatos_ZCMA.PRE.1
MVGLEGYDAFVEESCGERSRRWRGRIIMSAERNEHARIHTSAHAMERQERVCYAEEGRPNAALMVGVHLRLFTRICEGDARAWDIQTFV